MEQKEVVHKYFVLGRTTLDKTLQLLSHLSMEGFIKMKNSRFPMKGETNLYKLMNQSDPLTSKFLNEKVDLSKLKEYLSDQGLPFAFKETAAGTNLYFKVKDEALAKKAIERVITDIKKNPKKILRTPGTMTFEEKVAYARNNPKYKGSISKAPELTKGRGK
jgi:hypothetical protein